MNYVLALDQGTTSSRAIIYDQSLNVIAVGQRAFEQIYPQPGWVEHDPDAIWQSVLESINEALSKSRLTKENITAIGITNQRETVVVWERASGRPIYNAIVWQDRRTTDMCESLKADSLEALVTEKTGLLLDPYFSATKIRWILDNVPQAKAASQRGELACGTIDSWLIWKLTEGNSHVIEASNAARTLLLNIDTVSWDEQLLSVFDVPESILPTVVPSSESISTATISELRNIPISGVAGDQQAALFGQSCFSVGESKCTYGTGCFLLVNTGSKRAHSKSRLLSTIAWQMADTTTYALEGSVFMGGAVVQWLRDNLSLIKDAAEIESLAASVSDNGGVTMVPAFAGLGAPYWDPEARGAIYGLTRGTTQGHLARAALEGIAMQVTDVVEAMRKDTNNALIHMKVDGGASANQLLMQLQADFCGLTISRAKNLESTALGAAMLAGLGAGIWGSQNQLVELWQLDSEFLPQSDAEKIATARATWRDAIQRTASRPH